MRKLYDYQGKKMKERRIALGLRGEDIAALCDITQAAYSAYETGKRNVPARRRVQLAMALETTWNYLTMGEREENLEDDFVESVDELAPLPTNQAVEFAFQAGQMVASVQTMANQWRANPHLLEGLNPAYRDKLTRIFEAAL